MFYVAFQFHLHGSYLLHCLHLVKLNLSSMSLSVWAACTASPQQGVQHQVMSSSLDCLDLASVFISAHSIHSHFTHLLQQITFSRNVLHLSDSYLQSLAGLLVDDLIAELAALLQQKQCNMLLLSYSCCKQ